jgi:hypothetical protein
MTCICPAAGFCERYQREMGERLHEICRGINIAPEKAEAYRRNWASLINDSQPTCANRGEATGRLVECEAGCKSKLKTFVCLQHGECTPSTKGVDTALCRGCPDYREPLIVDCDTHGFGDAVLMAWIAEGSKGSINPCILKANGEKRELLLLLGQTVVRGGGISQQGAVDAEEAIGYSQPRIEFRANHLGMTAPPRRPLLTLSNEAHEWGRKVAAGVVLLAPQSNHRNREWIGSGWREMADMLTAARVPFQFLFGSNPRNHYSELPGIYNLPMDRFCAAVLHARAVVCIDSFVANLAGTLNVPTLCLLNFTTPHCFSHTPSIRCLQGEGRWAIRSIPPSRVFAALQELSYGISIPAPQ